MNLIEARKNTLASRIMNAQEATETTTDATKTATTDATKTATTDVNTKPEESSSSGTVWIILGVVVVIGLGIGGYFYTKNKAAQKEGGESDDRKLYKDQVV